MFDPPDSLQWPGPRDYGVFRGLSRANEAYCGPTSSKRGGLGFSGALQPSPALGPTALFEPLPRPTGCTTRKNDNTASISHASRPRARSLCLQAPCPEEKRDNRYAEGGMKVPAWGPRVPKGYELGQAAGTAGRRGRNVGSPNLNSRSEYHQPFQTSG